MRSRHPRGPPGEAALPAGAEQRASRRRRTEAAGGCALRPEAESGGVRPWAKEDGQRLISPGPSPQPESDESVLPADLVKTMLSACVDRLPTSFLRSEQVLFPNVIKEQPDSEGVAQ